MEPISWEKIASSKPFRFFVGPKGREFILHSALVASLSPALDKLINNANFKEANDGHAELTEVDEETFLCFVEYAYTRDYKDARGAGHLAVSTPSYKTQARRGKKGGNDYYPEPGMDEAYYSSSGPKRTLLWERFQNAICPVPQPKPVPIMTTTDATLDMAPRTQVTKSLLRHARIFVFADCYGIADLAQLALHNVGQALLSFQLSDQTAGDIVTLLRYCYETPAPDQLKSLFVLYAACNVETLWKQDGLKELMEEHGDLSTALVGSLVERLD